MPSRAARVPPPALGRLASQRRNSEVSTCVARSCRRTDEAAEYALVGSQLVAEASPDAEIAVELGREAHCAPPVVGQGCAIDRRPSVSSRARSSSRIASGAAALAHLVERRARVHQLGRKAMTQQVRSDIGRHGFLAGRLQRLLEDGVDDLAVLEPPIRRAMRDEQRAAGRWPAFLTKIAAQRVADLHGDRQAVVQLAFASHRQFARTPVDSSSWIAMTSAARSPSRAMSNSIA